MSTVVQPQRAAEASRYPSRRLEEADVLLLLLLLLPDACCTQPAMQLLHCLTHGMALTAI
jgi:hypothetical protein